MGDLAGQRHVRIRSRSSAPTSYHYHSPARALGVFRPFMKTPGAPPPSPSPSSSAHIDQRGTVSSRGTWKERPKETSGNFKQ